MTLGILRRAYGRALRTPRLVALHWLWSFALAAIAALTLAIGLASALGPLPVADTLLERPSVALWMEVMYEHKELVGAVSRLAFLLLAAALLLAPLLAGGTLEVLRGDDRRPFGHRFGRGAGRFYGRFLRLGAAALGTGLLASALFAGPLLAAGRKLGERGEETARWALAVAGVALAGLALVFVRMALDLARAAVVREDRRDAIRTYFRTLVRTLRHPLRVLGLWLGVRLPWLLVMAVYLALVGAIPVDGVLGIAAVFLLQQLVAGTRAGLRVALWSGELELVPTLAPPRPIPRPQAPLPSPPSPPPPAPTPDAHSA